MIEHLYKRIYDINPTLQGWCTTEKAVRMAKAICDSDSPLSVEIGIFGGRGLIAMALAHNHMKRGVAWGFDPWSAEACFEGKNDEANDDWWRKLDLEALYKEFATRVVKLDLLKQCYWARIKSAQAVSLFKDDSVGVFHSDGNHSEEISCKDVMDWKSKIKLGGYWVADDTDWPTLQKAKKLLLSSGFKVVEDHTKWMLFQKTENK